MRRLTKRIKENISNLLAGRCDGSGVCHRGFNSYYPLEPAEMRCDYWEKKKITNGKVAFYGCSRYQKN